MTINPAMTETRVGAAVVCEAEISLLRLGLAKLHNLPDGNLVRACLPSWSGAIVLLCYF